MADFNAEEDDSTLESEVEALRSIYIHELEVDYNGRRPACVIVHLHPATADNLQKQYVRLSLILKISDGYPNALPKIVIRNPRGLSDEEIERITHDLYLKAEEKNGSPMLFELIEVAKEHLTLGNTPSCQCAICLYGFTESDVFTKTECYHYFHSHCLARYVKYILQKNEEEKQTSLKWIDKNSTFEVVCPVCRLPISYSDLIKGDFPPPCEEEAEESFSLSSEMKQLQHQMAHLYKKQKSQGGIIDLDVEKKRYLLEISCREVNTVNASLRCQFVRTVEDCKSQIGQLDYTSFVYCGLGPGGEGYAVGVGMAWLLLLFVSLGITANEFLCPALFVISKSLRMSQNVAGVTLLAFGNGSPDIFASLAGIQQGKTELVIGSLVGGGIFVTTVVAGAIFLSQPFTLMKRPFLRDITFYLGATAWAFYLFYSGNICIFHAIGFVILYVLYIVVVVSSRFVRQRHIKATNKASEQSDNKCCSGPTMTHLRRRRSSGPQGPIQTVHSMLGSQNPRFGLGESVQHRNLKMKGSKHEDDPEAAGIVLTAFFFVNEDWSSDEISLRSSVEEEKEQARPYIISTPDGYIDLTSSYDSLGRCLEKKANSSTLVAPCSEKTPEGVAECLKDLFRQLCTVNLDEWKKQQVWEKLMDIFKSPIVAALTITTPVVNTKSKKHNWCRPLNTLHCVTGPLFITVVGGGVSLPVGHGVPLGAVVVVLSVCVALAVFFTTSHEPPKYHYLFSYLGFAVAVTWIYCLANEIVVLLQAVGIVFNLSDTILGLTVLAWGNCLLDFLSNLGVARKGFPRMGIAACFGGPFLTLLLGVGIPSIIHLLGDEDEDEMLLNYTRLITVLFSTLAASLVSTLVAMTTSQFHTKRLFGMYLLLLYAVFLVVAVLTETGAL